MPIIESHYVALDALTVETLAAEFARIVGQWLTPAEFKQMREDNQTLGAGLCASHDYCDANMAMDEALRNLLGADFDACEFMQAYDDAYLSEGIEAANKSKAAAIFTKWNAAASLAKARFFTAS